MTVDLTLVMASMLHFTPWEPMPLSLKPWNGKWSGPRAGAPLICTVPACSSSASSMASSRLRVKTDACRPSGEALQRSMASRVDDTVMMGSTGPNCSSYTMRIPSRTPVSTTGWIRFPARSSFPDAGSTIFAPLSTASATSPSMKSALLRSITAVTSTPSSDGCPTFSAAACVRMSGSRASSAPPPPGGSTTTTIFTPVQRCPE
mmetsp:Transcript_60498/g.126602  ORF Transcript_60498/g.126602 Transcript_60498/m.126602 type:complete len:204 (+) Transcript_60498:285-896(+)